MALRVVQRPTTVNQIQCFVDIVRLISSDFDDLFQVDWRCIVVDEAHRLKNLDLTSAQFERVSFRSRSLDDWNTVTNDMLELWALLHFIEPEIFSDAQSFINEFGE